MSTCTRSSRVGSSQPVRPVACTRGYRGVERARVQPQGWTLGAVEWLLLFTAFVAAFWTTLALIVVEVAG